MAKFNGKSHQSKGATFNRLNRNPNSEFYAAGVINGKTECYLYVDYPVKNIDYPSDRTVIGVPVSDGIEGLDAAIEAEGWTVPDNLKTTGL